MGLYASCLIQTLAWGEMWPKLIFLGLKPLGLKLSSVGLYFLVFTNYQSSYNCSLSGGVFSPICKKIQWGFIRKTELTNKADSCFKTWFFSWTFHQSFDEESWCHYNILLQYSISFVLMPFWIYLSSRLTRNGHILMSP